MELIEKNHIPYKVVSEKDLLRIKRADRLQGIVAEAETFKYTPFDTLLKKAKDSGMNLVFLDGLNDPQNLGSIIRICACFGNYGIVIPEHGSCEVNDTVVHVASGGENYVPVSLVGNLTTSLLKAKKTGFWAVGTDVSEGEDLSGVSLPFPLCVVLGSEGRGVRYGLKKHLDMLVNIPMRGAPLSLNVAMACAVICYEIDRQLRKNNGS